MGRTPGDCRVFGLGGFAGSALGGFAGSAVGGFVGSGTSRGQPSFFGFWPFSLAASRGNGHHQDRTDQEFAQGFTSSPLKADRTPGVISQFRILFADAEPAKDAVEDKENVRLFYSKELSTPCEPDRMAAAIRVLDHMRHHIEAISIKQRSILPAIQARMVKRLPFVSAHHFAM
jgi:hypothetical protein